MVCVVELLVTHYLGLKARHAWGLTFERGVGRRLDYRVGLSANSGIGPQLSIEGVGSTSLMTDL